MDVCLSYCNVANDDSVYNDDGVYQYVPVCVDICM